MPFNILIVHDDPQVRESLRQLLRSQDYALHVTGNGQIGLEMVDEVAPDLIMLNLVIPGLSGLEIIKRLKARPDCAEIPIVVISGIEEKRKRPEDFWREGLRVDEFIHKTDLERADLPGRIESLLRGERRPRGPNGEGCAAPGPDSASSSPADSPEPGPEEIVRRYIGAWDRHDFVSEFECLDRRITGDLSQDEYVQRRKLSAEDPALGPTSQRLAEVSAVNRSGGFAAIRIRREENRRGRVTLRSETYTLERTPSGWKITGVKTSRL